MNTVSDFVKGNPIYTAFIAILICGAIFFAVSTVARYDGTTYQIDSKVKGRQITRDTSSSIIDNESSTTFIDDFEYGNNAGADLEDLATSTTSTLPPVIIIGSTATTTPRVTTTRRTTTTRPRTTTTKRTTTTTTTTSTITTTTQQSAP